MAHLFFEFPLVIGLIVLIAGAVVAAVMLVRPASLAAYVQITPQPIATGAAVRATGAPIVQPTTAPSTISPVATSAPLATAAPQPSAEAVTSGEPARGNTPPHLAVLSIPRAIWLWLLPVSLIAGALVAWRLRRQRRMTYTNQNVGQLLATADATTRADNIKVMQNLAAQGLLPKELAAAAGIDLTQPHSGARCRSPECAWHSHGSPCPA